MTIHFGTSGWRAVVADEFNFPAVGRVTAAICLEFVAETGGQSLVIAHESINRMDGLKFIFNDDSWLLVRPSGTEPVMRIYAETESATDLEVLLEQGREYLLG